MRGRVRYNIEIGLRQSDGSWLLLVEGSGLFSRRPKQTVRSIAERWIHEQQGQLRGGRLIIRGKRADAPRGFEATVRVRVLADDESGRPLAAAYIGTDRMDAYSAPGLELVAVGHVARQGHA